MRERKIIHPGKLWCSAQDRETAATSKVGLMFYSMWMTKKKFRLRFHAHPENF